VLCARDFRRGRFILFRAPQVRRYYLFGDIGVAARAAGDTCVFKHASKIDASEIAKLNRNQTSNCPKDSFRKSASNRHREAFNQDEGHQGQQSPDREDGSHPDADEKVNCDCGYQLDPRAEAPRRLEDWGLMAGE
jgi:hypothetical protein